MLSDEEKRRKLIIITAPSGSGKTTIVRHLLKKFPELDFSISATTRKQRSYEQEGKDYYFLTEESFFQAIENEEFAEWEQVYQGCYYGTLVSEIERIWAQGKVVIFDVDVKGALSLKDHFPQENCRSIFIKVKDIKTIEERLINRKTETAKSLKQRVKKYERELLAEKEFDVTIVNNILTESKRKAEEVVSRFIQE